MGDQVLGVVKACLSCARVKAGFGESGKELLFLPIQGLGCLWGVDFAGALEKTTAANRWVMVAIEYFSLKLM